MPLPADDVWIWTDVDGILTEAERKTVVADLFAVQKQDGGWGLQSLGNWKRHDGKPDDTRSSDGYGTGFTIYVLRQAGVPADDARTKAGIGWLKANQRNSGRWFTRSQWCCLYQHQERPHQGCWCYPEHRCNLWHD